MGKVSVFIILLLAHSAAAEQAPFQVIELAFNGGNHRNPYWEVELDAMFYGPGNLKFNLPGYWDGGSVWKIRFSPLASGTWHYETSSNDPKLDGHSGSFVCAGVPRRGWLTRDPNIKQGFIWYGNKDPYVVIGDCWWGHLASGTQSEKFPFAKFKEFVDLWSSAGYSFAYCMLSAWNPEFTDWFNEGGKPWESDGRRFDLTLLNPGYFDEVDRRIAYANEKGVCVCLCLTESKGQINRLEIYKKLGRYVLARWAGANISIWLTGEYDDSEGRPFTVSDWDALGGYLQSINPYKHPISIHPLSSTAKDFGPKSWHDYVVQQGTPSNSWTIKDLRTGKPVISSEFYMGWERWERTPEWAIQRSWEVIMGGGYFCSGHPRIVYANHFGVDPLDDQSKIFLGYLSNMRSFLELQARNFSKRIASNHMASNGLCYRIGQDEFVLYLEMQGEVAIDLTGIGGSFGSGAFNVRTGQIVKLKSLVGNRPVRMSIPEDFNEGIIRIYRISHRTKARSTQASDKIALCAQASMVEVDACINFENTVTRRWANGQEF